MQFEFFNKCYFIVYRHPSEKGRAQWHQVKTNMQYTRSSNPAKLCVIFCNVNLYTVYGSDSHIWPLAQFFYCFEYNVHELWPQILSH